MIALARGEQMVAFCRFATLYSLTMHPSTPGWASPTPSEEDAIDVPEPDDVLPFMMSQRHALRTASLKKGNANLMQGLKLSADDSVPDQIRRWMQRNLLRVRDVFLQFDDDDNGRVDRSEFAKAMQELGFDDLDYAVGALFDSFDLDGNKVIDFRELHKLLVRSFQTHPHLAPTPARATNAVKLRKARLSKADSNMMQGLTLNAETEDDVPNQLRVWMGKNLLRVRDVFQQLDDDENGKVDRAEFRKALREMGCQAPGASIDAVFKSFDLDGSKAIDYREMHRLLVRSFQAHPTLEPLPAKARNAQQIRKARLRRQDSNLLQGLVIDDDDDVDAACARICERMEAQLVRVIDVFRQLDDDGSGVVDRHEFEKGLREMGCRAPPAVVDELFMSFDLNGDWTIAYDELRTLVSRGPQRWA